MKFRSVADVCFLVCLVSLALWVGLSFLEEQRKDSQDPSIARAIGWDVIRLVTERSFDEILPGRQVKGRHVRMVLNKRIP